MKKEHIEAMVDTLVLGASGIGRCPVVEIEGETVDLMDTFDRLKMSTV